MQNSSVSKASDIFSEAFHNNNFDSDLNRTTKRFVASPSADENNLLSPNSQKTGKPVYLFYRTPSNKENKKFEFK